MRDIEINKSKKVNDILAIVNLTSLLFIGMIILQKINTLGIDLYENKSIEVGSISIFIMTGILLIIYAGWKFFLKNNIKTSNVLLSHKIEDVLYLILFTFSVIISGANKSECKFIFLFLIITTTIRSGLRAGVKNAFISTMIILTIDLVYMPNEFINNNFENDIILSGVFILTAWTLGYYVKIEKNYILSLEDLVNKDGLTDVYNHRYFYEELNRRITEAKETGEDISVLFLDIDYFKHYNDLNGHQAGDEALKKIGSLLKFHADDNHTVARYGGEEFSVILPNTSLKEGEIIAERIRRSIEKEIFFGQEDQPNGNLTVSIGVSSYPEKAQNDMDLIKSADDALYRAKFFCKNRVESYVSILDEIKRDIDERDVELVTSIKTLISVINAKDKYTYSHSERVVYFSRLLSEELNLNEREKKDLTYGAYMHDIGKINIQKEILIKKMPLNNLEWEILKTHPQNGADIVRPIKSLKKVEPIILHHHERYDGCGYPNGLKGKEIPYLARVLTVVDSFDAMTSNRPYNKRKDYKEALLELIEQKGKQFDPDIVDAFGRVLTKNKNIVEQTI
ncbi:diguanylate cyclase [Clostridium chrysemydis]|uniref:bifunctional diguanylate cyclase/phosphohydrolase n=1 Tax=Clostridium chrysemydis TaxID=2665504 RepID=UPI001884019D|nr:diguanylate cyclase [Clostridium chrysemydis]